MLGTALPCARTPLRFVSVILFALVAAAPALSWAQSARASFFLQMLRQNPDPRVRVSAALRLGELHEADTVEALVAIYNNERDPTVQAAIIATFGTLGDGRALPVVQAATRSPNADVRNQARRALPLLQNAAQPGNNAGPQPTLTPRFLIGVGRVNSQAGAGGAQLVNAAQDALQRALQNNGNVVFHNGNAQAAQRIMRAQRLQGHFFNANIQSVQQTGAGVRVAISIAVSSYPGRVYEFESTSALTITGGSANSAQAQEDAVRRAIESAVNRAVNQLLQGVP